MRQRLLDGLREAIWREAPAWLVPDQTTLVGLGFLFSAVAAVWMARREGLGLRSVALGLSASFVGALVGARALGVVLHLDAVLADPLLMLDARRTGSISFGAVLGGCVAFWLYARRAKRDLWRHADALVPAAGVGMGLARLGCVAHGCDFGAMTGWGWGMRYPAGTPAFAHQLREGLVGPYQSLSLPTHPFPVLLAGWALGIFILFAASPGLWRRRPGDRALAAGALYLGGRFGLELLRSPATSARVGLLNVAQWLCVLGLVALWWLARRRRSPETEASAPAQVERSAGPAGRSPSEDGEGGAQGLVGDRDGVDEGDARL